MSKKRASKLFLELHAHHVRAHTPDLADVADALFVLGVVVRVAVAAPMKRLRRPDDRETRGADLRLVLVRVREVEGQGVPVRALFLS